MGRISLALLLVAALLAGCAGAVSDAAAVGSTSMMAESLTGSPVNSMTGERLGPVEAVVLDMETGNINYIVVSLEDYRQGKLIFTGAKKLVPILWQFFSITSGGHALTLNIRDEDVVYLAPSFKTLPDTDTEGWDVTVQTYWAGREPAAN